MSRRTLWILVVLFALTRIPVAWVAMNPPVYEQEGINAASDVDLYHGWASALVNDGQGAYSDIRIEYPPGSLPFMLIPEIVPGDENYLQSFVVMMAVIDVAAFFGIYLISKRWGSWWGLALWVVALPALGPIAYLRLDLVPAVATIWALERASAHDWTGSGGWFGVGAIAKLYPLLFLPAGLILAVHKKRFVLATAVVFVAPLLPLIPSFDGVVSSVLGYHMDRGIQVESLWGGILFLAAKNGSEVFLGYSFGALHFAGDLADTLKTLATVASVAGLALGTWLATRAGERDRAKALVEVCFVILSLSLATGAVFSPQFLLWLLAIAGAVGSIADSRLRPWIVVLIPVMVLSQAVFPFLYTRLLYAENLPVTLLWIRNSLVVILALGSATTLMLSYRKLRLSGPSTREPASV